MYIFDIKQSFTDKSTVDSFGFKTVTDVIIARSGEQLYRESEFIPNGDVNKEVTVFRDESDVKASLSSVNGKPIVNLHPPEDLSFNNLSHEVIGVAMNARFKDGNIIADLVFYKTYDNNEISLGYDANIVKVNDNYNQTDIEVNHIAIVPKGRCGKICKIQDNKGLMMGKVKINDKEFTVDDAVQAHIDSQNATIESMKVSVTDAEAKAIEMITAKAGLFKKAKEMNVTVEATDSNLVIKQKIVDSIPSLSSEGKTEEYLTAVVDTIQPATYIPAKVTDAKAEEGLKALQDMEVGF